ncbi:MAG: hypothetical protein AAGD38_00160 [Acidobacteriota bacterium]
MDEAKRQRNIKQAEDLLVGYIRERRKPLAEMALETLVEMEPGHPRLAEYRTWVADLDQDIERQSQIVSDVSAVRDALASGDLDAARNSLGKLRTRDPSSGIVASLTAELEEEERGIEEGEDIERRKQRFDALLETGEANAAEAELEALAQTSIPRVTLDFLRKRLDEARKDLAAKAELATLESVFRQHLKGRNWQRAREVAHAVGEQFNGTARAAEMFNEVTRVESEHRRRESVRQGIAALDNYIAKGQRAEAELTLQVLRRLDVDSQQLDAYERWISKL